MDYFDSLFGVKGKVALVTGGASGIGRMMAKALVMAGARVLICSRKGDECARVAEKLNAEAKGAEGGAEGSAEGFAGDLSNPESHKALIAEVKKRTDRLHILANNAGTVWGEAYETFPREAWDKVMNLNVTAIFELTRDLTPLLQKAASDSDPSRIVNTASIMGIVPIADGSYSYSVSKAAVIHLTRILANELASKKITVNAIAPGPFPSRMTAFATADARRAKAIERANPLGRMGRADDIAGAVLFLCGRGGSYVTGATVPIDGGYCVDTGETRIFPED